MDAEGGTGEVSRRACISGTDGSACCLPDVLAGNVVLKGLRLGAGLTERILSSPLQAPSIQKEWVG